MPRRNALSFVYFHSFISILLQKKSNAFCFLKHHNNINNYLFSLEIKNTANDIDYSKGYGRIQNEQLLEWEREEEFIWDGVPGYMVDVIDEFGPFGEEIDVIFALL